MQYAVAFVVATLMLTTGCAREVTLDASSDEAIRDSVLAMSEGLPLTESAQLDRAVSYFILRGDITSRSLFGDTSSKGQQLEPNLLTIADLDGFTADQIVQQYRARTGD